MSLRRPLRRWRAIHRTSPHAPGSALRRRQATPCGSGNSTLAAYAASMARHVQGRAGLPAAPGDAARSTRARGTDRRAGPCVRGERGGRLPATAQAAEGAGRAVARRSPPRQPRRWRAAFTDARQHAQFPDKAPGRARGGLPAAPDDAGYVPRNGHDTDGHTSARQRARKELIIAVGPRPERSACRKGLACGGCPEDDHEFVKSPVQLLPVK